MGAAALTARSKPLGDLVANLVLLREAEALAVLLDEAGIPALFLKGIALLESAYVDLSARPMADVDVLVGRRDLDRTGAVLAEAGFMRVADALVWCTMHVSIPVRIDVHTNIWCFATHDFWRRSEPKRSPTSRMRVLCAEDHLLHCIFHSVVQDGQISEQAIADCRTILVATRTGFRWEQFVATTRREGWERPVLYFLDELERVHPGIVPPEARRGLVGRGVPGSAWLSSDSAYGRMLRGQSRQPRRLCLLVGVLFPSLAFLRLRYAWMPRSLAFLLPVCRPFFLLATLVLSRLPRRVYPGRRSEG